MFRADQVQKSPTQLPKIDGHMNKTSLPQLRRPVPDIHEKPSSQSVERLLKQHNEKYNKLLQDVNEGSENKDAPDFPNLKILQRYITDTQQKKSLDHIMKHNPRLAQSLDLYAMGASKLKVTRRVPQPSLDQARWSNQTPTPVTLPVAIPQHVTNHSVKVFPKPTFPKYEFKPIDKSPPASYSNISNLHVNQPYDPELKSKLYIPSLGARVKRSPQAQPKFNYYVGPGNNGELVKRIMVDRQAYWQEVESNSLIIHFKWQQSSYGYNYERMIGEGVYLKEMVNLFEHHKEITSKIGLVRSLQRHYNYQMSIPFNIIPIVFILNFEERNWDLDAQSFVDFYLANQPEQLKRTPRKESLNLQFYKQRTYVSPYKYAPTPEQNEQQKYLNYIKLQDVMKSEESYLWLLKPADWNRGEGVHVFSSLEQLETLLTNYYNGWYQSSLEDKDKTGENETEKPAPKQKGYFYKCRQFVLQKYIEHPLLLHQRKFDIRVWVLMTHNMQFFLFREGYIRTSSSNFDLKDENPFVHLTNNAVQKFSKDYGQFEKGNQLSYQDFQDILEYSGGEQGRNFKQQCLPAMKEYIQISMYSARRQLNRNMRKFCFQLYGYDFMVDEKMKVWLIEVNTNPCIEESSPLLQMLIPRMIDDAFKLTLDLVFPPPTNEQAKPIVEATTKGDYQDYIKKQGNGVYPVANYADHENMWEFLGQY